MRALLGGIALAISTLVVGCEPTVDTFDDFERQSVPVFRREGIPVPAPTADPSSLRVMAWNIKFGAARIDFWFDYWGDRVQMTRTETAGNVQQLIQLINEIHPDVLLAEEVDVNSRRSAYVDMVQAILDGSTDLRYAAYFQSWASRYIPSEGLGRMDMGNAIFSRYPIVSAERIKQPQRTDLSGFTRDFYGRRMLGHAVLDLGQREVAVFVVHTDAYDRDGSKSKQLAQLRQELDREPRPFVVGGDFNELPPGALKVVKFPDEHPRSLGTEFEQPPYTPEIMRPFFDTLVPAIPLSEYGTTEETQRRFFTHTVLGPDLKNELGESGFWNRTLDYLFASRGSRWVPGRSDVLQSPGRLGVSLDPNRLSDHAPVVGDWILP
jgi:endonuclease/exonuclease/phosphatase family metal-dependent hydrolase